MMTKVSLDTGVSINGLAQARVDELCRCNDVRLQIEKTKEGTVLIDAGIEAVGGLEAGRRIAEICLGGLGSVSIQNYSPVKEWPVSLHVHTSNPVIACLASQYAGWSLSSGEGKDKFQALGSGPGRAVACKEPLFKELNYKDKAQQCVLVIEADRMPPPEVINYVAESCQLKPQQLTFIVTPTTSLAGSLQVVARVVEVAIHKVHELGFPLEHIADACGSAPLAPPAPDFITSMGRTNDAILFAGQVHLFVYGEEAAAQDLAQQLPSKTSKDYGKPFAEIFKTYDYDFFKIDPMLFSPAVVAVTHLPSGKTFHAGDINRDLLRQSFKSI